MKIVFEGEKKEEHNLFCVYFYFTTSKIKSILLLFQKAYL